MILAAAVGLATVYGLAQHSLVHEVSPADLEEYRGSSPSTQISSACSALRR